MGIRNALSMFRGSVSAVPPGAPRPSMTMWYDPGAARPPVSWAPASGLFETHWDWGLVTAMSVPGYWRARMTISQAIGGMPLAAWKGVQRVEPTPAVLRRPWLYEDRCATVAAWVGDLLDHGNAIGRIRRAVSGNNTYVEAIEPWPATDTVVGIDGDGQPAYVRHIDGQPQPPVPHWDIFHAKGVLPYPGALRGLGILEAGLGTLTRAQSEADYAANAFGTGVPAGLLRVKDPDLQAGSPDDPAGYASAHGLKKAWKENISTGDIAVLSDLIEFTPLAWSPTDAQMTEARSLTLTDVANLFNIDPYWVGSSQNSAPYQNVQDAAVQLERITLAPWIGALEAQFSAVLVRGTDARFNRDNLLRQQRAERVNTEIAMLGAGLTTVEEIRQWEGLPPLPADGPADDDEPASDGGSVTSLFPAESDSDANQPATGTE